LKELQIKHGCSIDIPRKESGSNLITVEGAKQALQNLKAEMEKIVGGPIKVVGALEAHVEIQAKLNLSSKPIMESLFFPDHDHASVPTFERFLLYLHSATKSLDVCVFTITDDRISSVLLDSHRTGDSFLFLRPQFTCSPSISQDCACVSSQTMKRLQQRAVT